MRSSQSQVRVISQVTRVKSSHIGAISSQVKSSQKLRLESTVVRVSDLTCYNTGVWCIMCVDVYTRVCKCMCVRPFEI